MFFRANTLSDAFQFFGGLFDGLVGPRAGSWKTGFITVAAMALGVIAIDLADRNRARLQPLFRWNPVLQGAIAGTAVVALIVYSGRPPQPFIYFQF